MTSKYVTESHAGHVTFPRVFPIGLWGVRYSLYIIYSCYYKVHIKCSIFCAKQSLEIAALLYTLANNYYCYGDENKINTTILPKKNRDAKPT